MNPSPRRPESAAQIALPWIVRLRYAMAVGQVISALVAHLFFGIDLPLLWIAVGPLLVTISNLWLARQSPSASSKVVAWIFVLDIACLTALLLLAGGRTNPFSLLYLVHITLAATILTERQTWLLGGLSTICFGLLFWRYRPIPALEMHFPGPGANLHLEGMWISFAVAAFLVAMFSARISGLLRDREETLFRMHVELAQKDRLASLATLAAGAAHELGTPLATIAVAAKEMELYVTRMAAHPGLAEDSKLIRQEVERCRAILSRMSVKGAEPAGEALERVPIVDLFRSIRDEFPDQPAVSVDERSAEGIPALRIPRHAVEQALIALLKNGTDASPAGSPVTLRAESHGRDVCFVVADDGEGMSPEVLRHVGEPFFTTKDPGKGMGLGVFLVRTVAEQLGGKLEFQSKPGGGTIVQLQLPTETAARA